MGFVLISAKGRKQGLAIPIRSRVFLIGSSAKSQIRSCKPGIGPKHCALVQRKKRLYIQDLRSGLPTQVNGLAVTPGARLPLKVGDHVSMGPMEFVIDVRKKKAVVPVAAPYAAPPLPVGKPAAVRAMPAAVSVRDALASAPLAPPPPSSGAGVWSAVAMVALAFLGLGVGVVLSRTLKGGRGGEQQVADADKPGNGAGTSKKTSPDTLLAARNGQKGLPAARGGVLGMTDKKAEQPAGTGTEKKPPGPRPAERKVEPKPEPKPVEPKPEPKPVEPAPKSMEGNGGMRVTFAQHVSPIFESRCVSCHGAAKKKGGLDLRTIDAILKGGDGGAAVVVGDLEKSSLWMRVDDGSMPPAGKPLTAVEKKAIQDWILGAKDGKLAAR